MYFIFYSRDLYMKYIRIFLFTQLIHTYKYKVIVWQLKFFAMFAIVKDGSLALILEILISMTRTLLECQLKLLDELHEQDPRQSIRNLAIQLNCSFNNSVVGQ
jgi:hypothetical protein